MYMCIWMYMPYIYIYISIYIQFLSTFAIVALLIEEIHLNHVNIAGPYNGFMYLNWCRFWLLPLIDAPGDGVYYSDRFARWGSKNYPLVN